MNKSNYDDICTKICAKNLVRLQKLRKVLTNLGTTLKSSEDTYSHDSYHSQHSQHSHHYHHYHCNESNNSLVTGMLLSSMNNNTPKTIINNNTYVNGVSVSQLPERNTIDRSTRSIDKEEEKENNMSTIEKVGAASIIAAGVYTMISDDYVKYYTGCANKLIKELSEEFPYDKRTTNIVCNYQRWKDIREDRTFKPFVSKVCLVGSLITFTRFVKNKYVGLTGLLVAGCSGGYMAYHYYNNHYNLLKDEIFALTKLLNTIDEAIIDYNKDDNNNFFQRS